MTWVRQSWQQPDQYVWLSEYLAGRGLQQFARSTIASIAGVFAVVPILMLFSPSGPQGRVGTIAAIAITVLCTAMAVLWLTRWPTHNQSELFVLGCNLSVRSPAWSRARRSPDCWLAPRSPRWPGTWRCLTLSRLLILTLLNATFTLALSAAGGAGGRPRAGGRSYARGGDRGACGPVRRPCAAAPADTRRHMFHTDPLTGLHNRRGFYRSTLAAIPSV